MKRIYTIIMSLLVAVTTYSQETLVVGQVHSMLDGSPLSAVNVYFENTRVGTQTDHEGFFFIRDIAQHKRLVFSSIGYKTVVVDIAPGRPQDVQVLMREDIRILEELFVLPGSNPALELMHRVRAARPVNDVYSRNLPVQSKEELLFLVQRDDRNVSRRFFNLFSEGVVALSDSTLFLPLYLSEAEYLQQGKAPRSVISRQVIATPPNAAQLIEPFTSQLQSDLNFYQNNLRLLGRSFVSPLSMAGNAYYRYFLIDSIKTDTGKQYYLRFRSKNPKNLAFNGDMWIDSASLALTRIDVDLSQQANLNYVKRLRIQKSYHKTADLFWFPESDTLSMQLYYPLVADSLHRSPEVFLQGRVHYTGTDSVFITEQSFAATEYSRDELVDKLAAMNDIPLMKTARWIADVVITGNMKLGIIDIGKVQNLARLSDEEGFRFNLPLRTNEELWENFTIGGHLGVGTRNKQPAYGAFASFRFPFNHKTVVSAGYFNDFRRIDYDYSDTRHRENPLWSGDEDISNTIFSLRSSDRLHQRNEIYASLFYDWNTNIESTLQFRHHSYSNHPQFPLVQQYDVYSSMQHNFISLNTRFSFNETTYEDHLERIYISNYDPVFYVWLEGGRAILDQQTHSYAEVIARMKHQVSFDIGQWSYNLEAGWIWGAVPWPLLNIPTASKAILFKRYHYNLMDYGEYAFDKFFAMHHEFHFNGILFNSIPYVRNLNLREMLSFKMLYGSLNDKHADIIELPANMKTLNTPYMEAGVGVSNIFRIFSLQSVWRLTDIEKPGVRRWAILGTIRFQF